MNDFLPKSLGCMKNLEIEIFSMLPCTYIYSSRLTR